MVTILGYTLKPLTQRTRDARRSPFAVSQQIERDYMRSLRKVARVSGNIVETHVDGAVIIDPHKMVEALENYAKMIKPWATRKSGDMITKTAAKNFKAWRAQMRSIGKTLREEINQTASGHVAQKLLTSQVDLIQSLPREAGQRAQELAMQAATGGRRASEVAEELERTTEVTENRAMLIARTEVAKSNAAINQSRAQAVGADTYVWRTMEDADVRESHDEVDGEVFSYADPPEFDDGGAYNPGEFCNCRCYAEPILAGDDDA